MPVRLFIYLMLFIVSSTTSIVGFAADIKSSHAGPCALTVTGNIEEGDFLLIKEIMDGNSNMVMCLDSEGGSYHEAIKIIAFVLQRSASAGTKVLRGARCYSACALIFMSGHTKVAGGIRPDRSLHIRGTLGFHGPYVQTRHAKADAQLAAMFYRHGLMAIGELMSIDASLMPDSLVAMALLKPPHELLMIDTLDKAGRWAIDLIGYRRATIITQRDITQACSSNEQWLLDKTASKIERWSRKGPFKFSKRKFRVYDDGNYGDEANAICVVDAYDAAEKGLFIQVTIYFDKEPNPNTLENDVLNGASNPGNPLWHMLDPSLFITQLLDE